MNPAGREDSPCCGPFAEELQVEDAPGKALDKVYHDFSETRSGIVVRTCPKTPGRCVTGRCCGFPESEPCSYRKELKANTCSGD